MTTAPCLASVPELAVAMERIQRELVRRSSVGNTDAVRVLDAAAARAAQRALEAARMIERRQAPGSTTPGQRHHGPATERWRDEERRVLSAMRAMGAPVAPAEVAPVASLTIDVVRNALQRLRKRGQVHHAGRGMWQVVAP